jgi:hypothetical protein
MSSKESRAMVLGLTALLLTACALANMHPRPTTMTTATASVAPSITPQPTITVATPSPSAIPLLAPVGLPCSAAQLEVRMGQAFGNLSHGILYLTFTDHGTRPCTLRGMPDVQLLDKDGRLLATPRLQYAAADYVPTLANDGVGLTPLSNQGSAPGPSPEGGIRGQASLPVQYFDGGCGNNQVAALRIRVDGGSLITPVSLPGGGPGCIAASGVFVSPFQPAEFLP